MNRGLLLLIALAVTAAVAGVLLTLNATAPVNPSERSAPDAKNDGLSGTSAPRPMVFPKTVPSGSPTAKRPAVIATAAPAETETQSSTRGVEEPPTPNTTELAESETAQYLEPVPTGGPISAQAPTNELAEAQSGESAGPRKVDLSAFAALGIINVDDDELLEEDGKARKLKLAQGINKGSKSAAQPPTDAVAAFHDAIRAGTLDRRTVDKAVQAMEPQDFPVAIAEIDRREWNAESHSMLKGVMKQWGKLDIDSAIAHADRYDRRSMQRDATAQAIAGWTEQNPDAAYERLRAADPNDDIAKYIPNGDLFKQLGQQDVNGAINKALALEDPSQKASGVLGALSNVPSDQRQNYMQDVYQRAGDPESQKVFAKQVVNGWRKYEPEVAASWIDTLPDEDVRKAATDSLLGSWGYDDPETAIQWVRHNPEDENTSRYIGNIAGRWARDAPNELASYLNQQPDSPSLDPAVSTLTKEIAKSDARNAMGWAESILDEKKRVSAITSTAREWMKQDPAGASAYILNHAELSEKNKERLLTPPPASR